VFFVLFVVPPFDRGSAALRIPWLNRCSWFKWTPSCYDTLAERLFLSGGLKPLRL
jgi:hypothetical protein